MRKTTAAALAVAFAMPAAAQTAPQVCMPSQAATMLSAYARDGGSHREGVLLDGMLQSYMQQAALDAARAAQAAEAAKHPPAATPPADTPPSH